MTLIIYFLCFLLGANSPEMLPSYSSDNPRPEYHSVTAKSGDGVLSFLRRYYLADAHINIQEFYSLNKLEKKDPLIKGKKYILPVRIYQYDGRSIRSTIGDYDMEKALRIQRYNNKLSTTGRRKTSYLESNILWVPHAELSSESKARNKVKPSNNISNNKTNKVETISKSIFGKKHETVLKKSSKLKNQVYYIVSGHGGNDPGAVCKDCSDLLCEDEYAYDVSLRLAKLLIEQGAIVEIIVQDDNDGIRDKRILKCDRDEKFCNGKKIPKGRKEKLRARTREINSLFKKHKKKGVNSQKALFIHVDSRAKNKKQDVFFCHFPKSIAGRELATNLRNTFDKKYAKYQKNRGYRGTIQAWSNLFVLRTTAPPAVLVELGNIQNKSDHRRILDPENRQALARWLYEGLIK